MGKTIKKQIDDMEDSDDYYDFDNTDYQSVKEKMKQRRKDRKHQREVDDQ